MQTPQPPEPTPARAPNAGDHAHFAFLRYAESWRSWTAPMLCAALLSGVALAAMLVPMLLLQGPLAAGLTACALNDLRRRPVTLATLWLGWSRTARFAVVGVVLFVAKAAPLIALAAGVYWGSPTSTPDQESGGLLSMMLWLMAITLGLIAGLGWNLWLSARAMYVLPLMIDRELGFPAALVASWRATSQDFSRLFLVHLLAYVVGNLGSWVCLVGLVATLPLYFLMVAASYVDRFDKASPSSQPGYGSPPPDDQANLLA